MISWPAEATGYTLESSATMKSGDWKAVPGVTGNSATVPMTGVGQFYRLRK